MTIFEARDRANELNGRADLLLQMSAQLGKDIEDTAAEYEAKQIFETGQENTSLELYPPAVENRVQPYGD